MLCTRLYKCHWVLTFARPLSVKRSSRLLCRMFANTGSTVPMRWLYSARPDAQGIQLRGSRYLGHISKKGDRYLRMLLTHGARSVLRSAAVAKNAGRSCTPLRSWALAVQQRSNHNKAACALANKLARICYATLRDKNRFDEKQPVNKKLGRQAFVMPA